MNRRLASQLPSEDAELAVFNEGNSPADVCCADKCLLSRNKKSNTLKEGLKVLICGPDCVKGRGEARVTVVSLAWHLFICANALSRNTMFDSRHLSSSDAKLLFFCLLKSHLGFVSFHFRSSDPVVSPREFRGVANFSTFLLDRSTGVLFMGARDAILAMDTNRLDQPARKVGRTGVLVQDEKNKKEKTKAGI